MRDNCMTDGEYQRILYKLIQTLWRFGLSTNHTGSKEYERFVKEYRRYTELTDELA